MLKGSDRGKLNHSDLIKKIDEQRLQITGYESKLKDLIRAYKGLNAEKNALQAVIKALGLQQEATTSVEKSHSDVQNETSSLEMNTEEKTVSEEGQIETLKKSLGVLIAEKSRLEAAFRSDRKALLMENEALKERLAKAANETEAQAEKLESRMLELRSKIKLIEGDRERELSDHGSVLAAVQQQYAKECVNSVQLEKQITELHQKLRKKEQAFKLLETDIVSLKEELGRTQDEVKFWQKRAEKTPAIQVLESELQDIKESSKNEITELKRKLMETMNTERENRLHELEQRLQEMSIEIGNFNRIRADLQHKIDQLEEKNTTLEDENALLEASKSVKGTDDESTSFDSLKENFIKIAQKLRDSKQAINFYELLGLEEISHEQKRRYEILKNEFEKYKSKTQAVLKSKSVNEDTLEDMESNTLSSGNECSYCALAEGDLRHMRTTVASLHDKLQCLEIDHSNAKKSYEEKITQLQFKIAEMEIAQEKSATDLRNQMHQRVAEMESELQKQRIRALNILAEKENELEITKGILASVRNQPNVDPVDPPQNTSFRSMKQRKNRSRDMCGSNASINERRSGEIWNVIDHSASDVDSCSSVVDEHHSECLSVSPNSTQALFASGTTAVIETRNIFYEQQLVKKEKQIIELRNAMRITELTVRDMQQATLTKDLQHFEMVEKLKDEIRILEGKLKFLTADSNMEYLRNIFIQLLYCDSSSRRKHILKAIGAVLKLSVTEMRAIEKRNL
ncbi:GRIP and coiled-coil domain-containing protein [Dirofilaria immitis]